MKRQPVLYLCLVLVFFYTGFTYAVDGYITNTVVNNEYIEYASLNFDKDNNPIIAYRSYDDNCLKFVKIVNGIITVEAIPDTVGAGYHCKIAADDYGGIGIAHGNGNTLLFSYKDNILDWKTTAIGKAMLPTNYPLPATFSCLDLFITPEGIPHIVYQKGFGQIGYAVFNTQISDWSTEIIYCPNCRSMAFPSIALDSNQQPVISAFFNFAIYTGSIMVVIRNGPGWQHLPLLEGYGNSIQIAPSGYPALAIHKNNYELCYSEFSEIGWISSPIDYYNNAVFPYYTPILEFNKLGVAAVFYYNKRNVLSVNSSDWQQKAVNCWDTSWGAPDFKFDNEGKTFITILSDGIKLITENIILKSPADYNSDSKVNFFDFAKLAQNWNQQDGYSSVEEISKYWLWDNQTEFQVADFNHDNTVNTQDLLRFLDYWLLCDNGCGYDIDKDGLVNLKDFAIFSDHWAE